MPTSNEIYEKVREILVDALGADESECTPDATLMGDLGAESIDFLDIVFRLEKTFNVKIPRGELFPDNIGASDPSRAKDGALTPAGVAELKKRLPYADVDKFAKDPKIENISDLFTVGVIVKFMEAKLAAAS
jgi:acyl carrier protein